jgi:hypothetical protein
MRRLLRRTRVSLSLLVLCLLAGAAVPACRQFPPALTGITISPAGADGTSDPLLAARTRLEPPVPLIAVRPGADPLRGALFMNHPESGTIAITLGRGEQSFLLFTLAGKTPPPYSVALFLEHEPTPALSALLSGGDGDLHPNSAPTVIGLDGTAVANTSTLSAVRKGYRIDLRAARFPLSGMHLDVSSPWMLYPDNIADAVGVITLDVRPVAAR